MDSELLKKLSEITVEEQRILDGGKGIEQQLYSDNKTLVVDSRKFLNAGKTIRVRPHTRFIHFPAHRHNYVEMVYMCQGKLTNIINGTTITLRTGELLILGQKAVQEILPAGRDDIAVNFIILPEFFDQTLLMLGTENSLIKDFIIGCFRDSGSPVDFLYFRTAGILPVQNLLENLVWTIVNDTQNKHSINRITMGLLFLQLAEHADKIDAGRNSYEQEILIHVMQYIDENYKDGELSDLAAELGCDFTWLSRMIRKMTGSTYTELLQKKRMDTACRLLSLTSMPVTDVSLAVGYDNFSYFHRLFRKMNGMSPRSWRCRELSVPKLNPDPK